MNTVTIPHCIALRIVSFFPCFILFYLSTTHEVFKYQETAAQNFPSAARYTNDLQIPNRGIKYKQPMKEFQLEKSETRCDICGANTRKELWKSRVVLL